MNQNSVWMWMQLTDKHYWLMNEYIVFIESNFQQWEIIMLVISMSLTVSLLSILHSPFSCSINSCILILFPIVCNLFIKWIVKVWCWQQSLDWKQNSSDLQSWRPFVLQDIQTDSTKLVDVGMVNFSSEQNFWWNHWILIRQK